MPLYDCYCTHCEHEFTDVWLKFDDLPNVETPVECEECHKPTKYRSVNGIKRININGVDYGGDASRVRRFEVIGGLDTVDAKESAKQKRVVLKDGK